MFSSNQAAERANKEQNMAATNNRGEANMKARLSGAAQLKEIHNTASLNEEREPFRGPERYLKIIRFIYASIEKIKATEAQLGEEEFKRRVTAQKKQLGTSFAAVRYASAVETIEAVVAQPHVPSAREMRSGYDESSHILRWVQFGMINTKPVDGEPNNNLSLLRDEWKGRRRRALNGGLGAVEEGVINNMNITLLKSSIRGDEASREREDDEPGYNQKFFKPLYTDFESYTIAKKK